MKYCILVFWAMLAYPSIGQVKNERVPFDDRQKIDYLIKCVEELKMAKFDRNGTLYDAQAAAAHLTMKREKAGEAIKTVDDFIDKVASKSSMTGIPYKIIYDDGTEILAKDFFLKCLNELENIKKL
jgi:hypothetical protein